jgi:cAMP phosphodiesterase
LRQHIFNGVIWPDFTVIPSVQAPFVRFVEISVGQILAINGKNIEVMSAVHTVPACGYAVSAGQTHWVFTGDTERNPAFWQRLNQLDVGLLVIETAFSNRESDLAKRSLHLSPAVLASELSYIELDKTFPIYITHTKPAETEQIMTEIEGLDSTDQGAESGEPFGIHVRHDVRWLRAGQEFVL